jgi:hypothetical protein
MSSDENSKESVDSEKKSETLVDQTAETINEVVEDISDVVEDISDAAESKVSKFLALKESNPKLFYGGIAGLLLFVVFLFMMMSGGSKKNLPVAKMANLSVGQSYQLQGVNTYDPDATIRLVPVPGSMAAYDDTEEADREGECEHMLPGTKVKALQIQESLGTTKFVQVEMLEGECAGQKGWVISNNLQ